MAAEAVEAVTDHGVVVVAGDTSRTEEEEAVAMEAVGVAQREAPAAASGHDLSRATEAVAVMASDPVAVDEVEAVVDTIRAAAVAVDTEEVAEAAMTAVDASVLAAPPWEGDGSKEDEERW